MEDKWEVEVWQAENGRWRWALYRNDDQAWMGQKSERSKTEAINAAKAQKELLTGNEQRERVSLD